MGKHEKRFKLLKLITQLLLSIAAVLEAVARLINSLNQ